MWAMRVSEAVGSIFARHLKGQRTTSIWPCKTLLPCSLGRLVQSAASPSSATSAPPAVRPAHTSPPAPHPASSHPPAAAPERNKAAHVGERSAAAVAIGTASHVLCATAHHTICGVLPCKLHNSVQVLAPRRPQWQQTCTNSSSGGAPHLANVGLWVEHNLAAGQHRLAALHCCP